jgi:protein SCO1
VCRSKRPHSPGYSLVPLKHLAFAVIVLLSGCAKHYKVEGLVTRVNRQQQSVTVSHRDIAGYMPAMMMPFHVANAHDLDHLSPGCRIAFHLRVSAGKSTAHAVRLVSAAPLDVPAPEFGKRIAIGAKVPEFTLLDESGKTIRLAEYRGKIVVLDFIYTRCPLPDVCPRLSANFATLQRRVPGVSLLSVTVDPEFDRPEVLADYARRWGADPLRWHFLTGTPEQVRNVAASFGLVFWAEEAMITHTVATAVIDRDGKLAGLIDTPSYRWEQLRDLISSVAGEAGGR